MDTKYLVGHLAAWNYYQSVPSASNKKFVAAFKAFAAKNKLPGGSSRVTDDPMEAAYISVNMWALAAAKAKSFDVDKVRKAVYGMKFNAPGMPVMFDERNHHLHKPVLIGEIKADGQFKVVWKTSGLVKPEPWSEYTSPDKGCDWVDHQGTYTKK
jgi:urea transport system substrate-binding protein